MQSAVVGAGGIRWTGSPSSGCSVRLSSSVRNWGWNSRFHVSLKLCNTIQATTMYLTFWVWESFIFQRPFRWPKACLTSMLKHSLNSFYGPHRLGMASWRLWSGCRLSRQQLEQVCQHFVCCCSVGGRKCYSPVFGTDQNSQKQNHHGTLVANWRQSLWTCRCDPLALAVQGSSTHWKSSFPLKSHNDGLDFREDLGLSDEHSSICRVPHTPHRRCHIQCSL